MNSAATGMAKMERDANQSRCSAFECTSSGVVVLAGQHLCLDHFLIECYQRLDRIEPVIRNYRLDQEAAGSARAVLQECANQTLLVCLRHPSLNNLERSRLLEILLRCGDLQVLLHRCSLQLI
jgi:hypothetical protein